MIIKRRLLDLTRKHLRNMNYWKVRNWYANLVKPREEDPPYRHIIQIGDPRLRTPAEDIPVDYILSPEVQTLIKVMTIVFNTYNCVGLSAPQIGLGCKLFLLEFNQRHAKNYTPEEFKNKEMSFIPFTVIINPEFQVIDFNKVVLPESCESIKGFWADVPRFRSVQLQAYNENAEKITINAKGWLSRIIQHEVDHLNGKLYTDVMDRKTLTCSCWEAVNERRGKVILPYAP